MYRFRWITPVLVAAVMGAAGSGLEAQSYRNAIGLYGGGAFASALTSGSAPELELKSGWSGGLEVERWLGGGRAGIRVGSSFGETEIVSLTTDVNLYAGGASLLLRLLSPRAGRVAAPFVSLGAGAVHYNMADVTPFVAGDVLLEKDPVTRPAAMAGFGLDLAPTTGVGLRLEAVDRVALESPFMDADGAAYDPVHHLRYTAALQIRFGRLGERPPVFAVAEPVDAPPPPMEEAPEPEPDAVAPAGVDARLAEIERAVRRNTEEMAVLRTTLTERERAAEPVVRRTAQRSPAEGSEADATAASGRFYTVQVAAYEDPAGARRLADRMSRRQLPTWISRFERAGRVYHRVRVGVLPTEAEARQLGRRLRAESGSPVWVVPVEPTASVSPDAVVATRAFMSDG